MTSTTITNIYTYQKIEMTLKNETETHFFYQNAQKGTNKKPSFKIAFNKNTQDLESDSIIYLESKLNHNTYSFEYTFDSVLKNLTDEESISIYVSTVEHLIKARTYNKNELKNFQLEQIVELAKYADIDQFNEICSVEINNPILHNALAIRYLMFFDQVDLEIEDFCEMFKIDNRIHRFIEELNINNTICSTNIIIASVLSRLDTPPTYDCLSIFQKHFYDDCNPSYFVIEKPFSHRDFFNTINGFENDLDKDTFIKGYNKHFMFAVEAALHLADTDEGAHPTLIAVCNAMDQIHRSGIDKEWIEKLFNFSPEQSDVFVSSWGDKWRTNMYFNFEKGTLFDYWLSHKKECWHNHDCADNLRYFLDNFKPFLVNSNFNFDALYESIPEDLKTEMGEELSREEIFGMKEIEISNYDMLSNILKNKD